MSRSWCARLARPSWRVTDCASSAHMATFPRPRVQVLAAAIGDPFDLILLAVKSYSLDEAMEQFAPAVGPKTAILPVINGMSHIDRLAARFGDDRVLGGMAAISATLDAEGRIVQFVPMHDLVYGERTGGFSDRTQVLSKVLGGAGFNARASDVVMQDMWEKWAGLATTAGITCLMRASLGDILAAPGGGDTMLRLFRECSLVAERAGFALRQPFVEFCTTMLSTEGSPHQSIHAARYRARGAHRGRSCAR